MNHPTESRLLSSHSRRVETPGSLGPCRHECPESKYKVSPVRKPFTDVQRYPDLCSTIKCTRRVTPTNHPYLGLKVEWVSLVHPSVRTIVGPEV